MIRLSQNLVPEEDKTKIIDGMQSTTLTGPDFGLSLVLNVEVDQYMPLTEEVHFDFFFISHF